MNLNMCMYFIDMLQTFSYVLSVWSVIGGFFGIACGIGYLFYKGDPGFHPELKFTGKWFPRIVTGLILASFLQMFIPDKSTIYLMTANSYLKETNVPEKVMQALNLKLDKYIKELEYKNDH